MKYYWWKMTVISEKRYPDISREVPLVKDTTLQPTLTQYFTKTIYG